MVWNYWTRCWKSTPIWERPSRFSCLQYKLLVRAAASIDHLKKIRTIDITTNCQFRCYTSTRFAEYIYHYSGKDFGCRGHFPAGTTDQEKPSGDGQAFYLNQCQILALHLFPHGQFRDKRHAKSAA